MWNVICKLSYLPPSHLLIGVIFVITRDNVKNWKVHNSQYSANYTHKNIVVNINCLF